MKGDTLTVLQFVLSALAIAVLGFLALLLIGVALVEGFFPQDSPLSGMPLLITGTALAVTGLLVLPSTFYSFQRLIGRPSSPAGTGPSFLRVLPLVALPVVLLAGYLISKSLEFTWMLLPPFHILAVGLPVLWFLLMGLQGLPPGSNQRAWGVFASGLVLGPVVILLLEMIVLVAFIVLAVLWVASQPEIVTELESLASKFQYTEIDPEQAIELIGPYLAHPLVLAGALSFTALLVPLIEELIKPVGVWLLLGRNLTPAAGFAAGLISGAGYALFESLALTTTGEDWLLLVVARMGTAIVHIFTTGLTGWAIATAWQKRRFGVFLAAYLTAAAVHGIWNALTVMGSFSVLLDAAGEAPIPVVERLGAIAPVALVLLTLGTFYVLLRSNRKLRSEQNMQLTPGPQDAVL
jgi:RsiW-degrading membrane proteinase PrsW (M82 family)